MSGKHLKILNLYPRQLNIYGDAGNLLVLRKRLEWRAISVQIIDFNPGDEVSKLADVDLIVGGGGQDSGQMVAHADLLRIAPAVRELVEQDVPALVVCGCYQLFGNYFKTVDDVVIEGIGILNMHTIGGAQRQIGNVVALSKTFGEVIGFENHSGKTYLGSQLEPLAQVVSGWGNNGEDQTEGACHRKVIGTYLHGPLLPKNPQVADYLLASALEHRYGEPIALAPLTNEWVEAAREVARDCPR